MEDINITRDVIADLLPVYESGEASEDTRNLVREFLERDPEFARLIPKLERMRIGKEGVAPSPDLQMKSLIRTKRLMRQQTSVMAVAIFFTLAPFVFTIRNNRVDFLLIRDAPTVGGIWFALAAAMWIIYFMIRSRMKVV